MNDTTFTVKVIAGELEVSKTTVQRTIDALGITPVQTKGQKRFYTALDAARIADSLGKTAPQTANRRTETEPAQNRKTDANRNKTETENFENGPKPPQNEGNDRNTEAGLLAVIDLLREQLREKDQQIAAWIQTADQAQKLQASLQQQLAEASQQIKLLTDKAQTQPQAAASAQEGPQATVEAETPTKQQGPAETHREATETTHTEAGKEQPTRRGFWARLFGRK